jgi:hypothetical protein
MFQGGLRVHLPWVPGAVDPEGDDPLPQPSLGPQLCDGYIHLQTRGSSPTINISKQFPLIFCHRKVGCNSELWRSWCVSYLACVSFCHYSYFTWPILCSGGPQVKTESPSLSCMSQPNQITNCNSWKTTLHDQYFFSWGHNNDAVRCCSGVGGPECVRFSGYGSCCQGLVPSAILLVHWSVDDWYLSPNKSHISPTSKLIHNLLWMQLCEYCTL